MTEEATTDLVKRLRDLFEKATPGPWSVIAYYTGVGPDELCRGMLCGGDDMATGVIDERQAPDDGESLSHDLDLIVTLRNDAMRIIEQQQAEIERLRELLANPPKHKFWGAGEPECPREIKCGNGELHTLRCKLCGQDNPRDQICRGSL